MRTQSPLFWGLNLAEDELLEAVEGGEVNEREHTHIDNTLASEGDKSCANSDTVSEGGPICKIEWAP